jgi:hypothetical protein
VNAAAVRGLIQRRGNVLTWYHAIPPDPGTINPAMGQPTASLGGPKLAPGTFGEQYPTTPHNIRDFLSSKFTQAQMQLWGNIEIGDMQLDVAVPFRPEPAVGIVPLPPDLLCVYNEGRFAQVKRKGTTMDAPQTMAFDRFGYAGRLWIARARAVPLVDQNVTFAYRILVAEFTL